MSRVDSAELTEWQAFERIEPFGGLHDELMAGQIAAVTANVHRDPKKSQAFEPADFGPGLRRIKADAEPALLADPEAHSDLLMRKLFAGTLAKQQRGGDA